MREILSHYGKYYKEKHADAVDMATWELHYEDFMIDEKTKVVLDICDIKAFSHFSKLFTRINIFIKFA